MSGFNWNHWDEEDARDLGVTLSPREMQDLLRCTCAFPRYDTFADGRVRCRRCDRPPMPLLSAGQRDTHFLRTT